MKMQLKFNGEAMKQGRWLKAISQEELARKAGLSLNMVGLLERGSNQNPTIDTINRLAKALEMLPSLLVE